MSQILTVSQPLPSTGSLPARLVAAEAACRLGWIVLAAAGLGLFGAVSMGGFRMADPVLIVALLQFVAMGVCGAAIRARGWVQVGTVGEAAAQILLAGLLAPLLSVVVASTNLPYRDEELLALDMALFGFDWRNVIAIAQTQPVLTEILSYAYASLMLQLEILFAMLLITRRAARAQAFCLAWILTLAATIAIFPLVPALGGYLHYGIAQSDTHVLVPATWRHLDILGPARDGTLKALSGETMGGIVTFPSFHAASAALLAWGFWGLPLLRWPALAVNLTMLASAPVIGGHYLVDVVAGLLLAGFALWFVRSLTRTAATTSP